MVRHKNMHILRQKESPPHRPPERRLSLTTRDWAQFLQAGLRRSRSLLPHTRLTRDERCGPGHATAKGRLCPQVTYPMHGGESRILQGLSVVYLPRFWRRAVICSCLNAMHKGLIC